MEYIRHYGKALDLKGIQSAVLCMDASLAKKISLKYQAQRVQALGACFDVYQEFQQVIVSQFGFGAPASLLQLEYLKTFGIKNIFSLGVACSLSPKLNRADGVWLQKAYGRSSYASFDDSTSSFIESSQLEPKLLEDLQMQAVTSWTSDAPYQETDLNRALSLGVSCLEMEARALMGVAQQGDLNMFCLALISDRFYEGQWELGFSHKELKQKALHTLELLLKSKAVPS